MSAVDLANSAQTSTLRFSIAFLQTKNDRRRRRFYTVFTRPMCSRGGDNHGRAAVVVVVVGRSVGRSLLSSPGVAKTASRAICAVCVVFQTCHFSIVRPYNTGNTSVHGTRFMPRRLVNFIYFFFFFPVPSCDESPTVVARYTARRSTIIIVTLPCAPTKRENKTYM